MAHVILFMSLQVCSWLPVPHETLCGRPRLFWRSRRGRTSNCCSLCEVGKAEPRWDPNYGQRYQRALRKMSPFICQVSFILSVESDFHGECTWYQVWCFTRYFDADGWMPIKDIAPIIAQVTVHFGSDIFIPISTFLHMHSTLKCGSSLRSPQKRCLSIHFKVFGTSPNLTWLAAFWMVSFDYVLQPSSPWLAFNMKA